uniref:Bromo domain-containing protein n=1 Tax=Cyprinus carpio TaxID=7962 RepID=A0A8C1RNQ0_CYPCA
MKPHSDSCENAHACDSASHGSPDMNPDLRLTLTSCNGSTDQSGLEDPAARSEHDLAPEIQQAYRIFQSFLSEKHKSVAAPFWRPMGPGDQAEMCFRRMDDKFVNREYESITAFVADFRLMLENCYRCHGVDHWISRQAQKLETILEQKLTLLSRTLREKTTLAVTSRGRFGAEDEKAALGSSSRRRWVPRSITGGGSESVMVQALRLEELQRAKDEKRQREQERKEAEEASVKELEEWESSLLSLAEPCPLWSLWELPAIGHFLCLAQTALHLPEIVFYELERCLLMPRCSVFLAKIMTALLSPPQKRSGVQRRAPMRYRAWESELRRRVQSWYRAVGRAEDTQQRLGLCPQFFWTLGAVSPLEETPFHLLPLQQRVWLLKGLCDHVYETQKEVQDAVLAQPIHECRESILGYDQQDNAYIHFPHFCGADLRIYCQSPCGAVELSLPPIHVQRSLEEPEEAELKDQTCGSFIITVLCFIFNFFFFFLSTNHFLDDLRVLISKIEDQLDELDGKKRSGRWPHKRAAVKELHITLIRLLNELSKHDPTWSLSSFLCFNFKSECLKNVNHESRCLFDRPDVVMHSSESGPFTRGSKRRHTGAISEELSPCKRGKMDPESSLTSDFNVEVASREQATVNPQASVLPDTMSSFHGTCKPIQALLAKSVGNKVTLISHPKAAVMAQALRDHNKTASVTLPPVRLSTTCAATTGQVVYKTAGGVGLLRQGSTSVNFSVQSISDQKSGAKAMQQVVILPSNLLIQSTENKAAQASVSVPKTTTYMSNVSGFTIPENKVPVQPVAPLKDTSTVRTPSAVVTPSLRNLMTVGVPKKTTEPKVALNKSASSGLTKSDAKQELRTVCIRDSQSILVTTRGGNTGVVKVQTSESGTGALPPSPVFNISPQLHAFLVSKSSTSHTQAVSATIAAKSRPGVTPQSTFVAGTVSPLTLNQISNTGTTGKTTIPGKSALLATSKGSDSFLINAKDCAQQNTVSKCGTKPPQKRAPPGSTTPDQSTFQKVFLVTPSPNIPSKVTTTTATCTVPGSRVMFISNSALIIPKETSTSEVNITSTSTPALNVVPNLGTLSCTSGTSIQSIGVPGLTSRILGTNKKPEASMKTTPVIVSRVPATSLTGGLQIGPKSCLVASRSLSGNTESALKVPRTVDGKTLTFSTLGTGHMASSALLSVVKPDVPPSVSALNALHCKPGLSSGSSTSNTSSSYSGSLITKHTTLPINVTANKPVITSLCNSHSLIKTTANTSASAVSSTFALSCSSTLTPPVVMTSGIQPLTSATKNVQEKIVINTTAPLAPGTQLLINNTRFVVPSQGLAPGSHVLLISNSCPGGMQGSSAVGSQRLQVQSPVGPQSFLGSNPVGSQRLYIGETQSLKWFWRSSHFSHSDHKGLFNVLGIVESKWASFGSISPHFERLNTKYQNKYFGHFALYKTNKREIGYP